MGKQVVVTEYDTRYLLQCANCGFQTPISLKMGKFVCSYYTPKKYGRATEEPLIAFHHSSLTVVMTFNLTY